MRSWKQRLRKHPVLWAITVFIVMVIPGFIEPWWALISDKPLIKVLIERVSQMEFGLKWLYFLTIPFGTWLLLQIHQISRESTVFRDHLHHALDFDQRLKKVEGRTDPRKRQLAWMVIALNLDVVVQSTILNAVMRSVSPKELSPAFLEQLKLWGESHKAVSGSIREAVEKQQELPSWEVFLDIVERSKDFLVVLPPHLEIQNSDLQDALKEWQERM